jgi:hypothetical protein
MATSYPIFNLAQILPEQGLVQCTLFKVQLYLTYSL